jgi:hypothetical protein
VSSVVIKYLSNIELKKEQTRTALLRNAHSSICYTLCQATITKTPKNHDCYYELSSIVFTPEHYSDNGDRDDQGIFWKPRMEIVGVGRGLRDHHPPLYPSTNFRTTQFKNICKKEPALGSIFL